MNIKLEKFNSGWIGLSIAFSVEDIDVMIERLNDLKSGSIDHFHFRNNDFEADSGVADIEVTRATEGDHDNMIIE